jgi:hypothetical protein
VHRVRVYLADAEIGGAAAGHVDQHDLGGRAVQPGPRRDGPEKAAIAAGNQPAEVYRHCPECGADQFTQRPVR